jgi:dTDP-4-dehydrorhamnose 3,5-epimerase
MESCAKHGASMMKVELRDMEGVQIFNTDTFRDHRGEFERLADIKYLPTGVSFMQSSLSKNSSAGTLRGMHFQSKPSLEWKLLNCIAGEIFDVLVDVRKTSPTYGAHASIYLNALDNQTLLVPPGVAHGFLTLCDHSSVIYFMSDSYQPSLARKLKHDDRNIGITWPRPVEVISKEDSEASPWPLEY